MLNVLPEPAATIVAVAAFTGVRKGAQFDHLPGWLPCVGGIPEGGTGRGDPPLPSPASGPAIIRGLDPVHKWKSEL
jgi:hypothetical protein